MRLHDAEFAHRNLLLAARLFELLRRHVVFGARLIGGLAGNEALVLQFPGTLVALARELEVGLGGTHVGVDDGARFGGVHVGAFHVGAKQHQRLTFMHLVAAVDIHRRDHADHW